MDKISQDISISNIGGLYYVLVNFVSPSYLGRNNTRANSCALFTTYQFTTSQWGHYAEVFCRMTRSLGTMHTIGKRADIKVDNPSIPEIIEILNREYVSCLSDNSKVEDVLKWL